MDVPVSASAKRWRARIRTFAESELIPWEVEAEMNSGVIPQDIARRHHDMAVAMGLSRMDVPAEHGGLGLSMEEQVAIWEQLGRVTNALCWCFPEAQKWMFDACSPQQIEQYVQHLMDGSKHDCYAITEEESGSHETVNTTATRVDGGYLINGEKWFVTSANLADFFWLQAKTDSGDDSLFFCDIDAPGVTMKDNPLFSHTFPAHHPTYEFKDVFIPEANRIGTEGAGMDYSRSWFRHERMMIAARVCGAATRLIEEGTQFAKSRNILGEKLADKQVIQFMLANSAAELWAARLMIYATAQAEDRGEDLKALHVRCSMAKLYASEMANRVVDRVVQIFGGRGYMRQYAPERFYRELRVDRIWEGSSEIQRMIIAKSLLKRGLEGM
ncbi:MAG: acyl-CoA dehydrogenase family protein [Pseudomonadales bacterium]